MTPPGPNPVIQGNNNVMQRLGFALLTALLLLVISRATELEGIAQYHFPLILACLAAVAATLSGNLWHGVRSRVGFLYLILTSLYFAGVPFVQYNRGGVFNGISQRWVPSLLDVILVLGLTVTYAESKRLMNALAYSGVIAVFLSIALGDVKLGRLAVEYGTLGNPNFLALILVLSLPALLRLHYKGGAPGNVRKLVITGLVLVCILQMLKTGSRAGFIGLILAFVSTLLGASLAKKVQLVLGAGLVVLALLVALPADTRARMFRIVPDDSGGDVESADASTLSREALLWESVDVALHHPLFGVGADNFAMYINLENQKMGRLKEAWLGTHNTYTQIASEAGIPALFVFVGLFVISGRQLSRLIRATRHVNTPLVQDIYATAFAMRVTLITLCGFMFFFHIGYQLLPHLIVAFCVSVARTGEAELAQMTGPAAPPQELWLPGPSPSRRQLAGAPV